MEAPATASGTGPKFFHTLGLDSITAESDEVKEAAYNIHARKEKITERHISYSVHGLTHAITHSPLLPSSLPVITNGWTGLEGLIRLECTSSIALRKTRADIMLINYAAWYWLDVFIVDQCKAITDGTFTTPDCVWLSNLVRDIDKHYRSVNNPLLVLKATDYGIALPNASYTLGSSYTRVPKDNKRVGTRVVQTVVHVLEQWLQFPSDGPARQKAWFVHVVVTEFGYGMLYLDGIWKVYTNLRNRLFREGPWRLETFKTVKSLRSTTSDHPLYDPTSPERAMIDQMATLIDGIYHGSNGSSADESSMASGSSADGISQEIQNVANDEMRQFQSFLQQSLRHALKESNGTEVHPKLAEILQNQPDKFLCFRELAPSRERSKSADGPYRSDLIRTIVGIFSAVVWRGITFATEFAMRGPMVFTSAEHFKSLTSGLPVSYVCDKAAYGRSNPGRDAKLVDQYWDSLKGDTWERFVSNRVVPFMECWLFFVAERKRFPQLGPLASYLLTADLCYAGVAAAPTLDDMTTIIHSLNKTSVTTLERLHLISPRPEAKRSKGKCNKKECRRALECITKVIYDSIPQHLHARLHVDLIMVEHTLCKFGKAAGRNKLTVAS